MEKRVHNLPSLKERRRQLRNDRTPAEARLWGLLKGSQLENRKFRRQHSVESYVLDFYCPSERLCIELDGETHYIGERVGHDRARTDALNHLNIRVLRFTNTEVFENPESVLEEIKRHFLR